MAGASRQGIGYAVYSRAAREAGGEIPGLYSELHKMARFRDNDRRQIEQETETAHRPRRGDAHALRRGDEDLRPARNGRRRDARGSYRSDVCRRGLYRRTGPGGTGKRGRGVREIVTPHYRIVTDYQTDDSIIAANPRSALAINARTRAGSFLPRCPERSVWVNESTPHGRTAAIACATFSADKPPARMTGISERSTIVRLTDQSCVSPVAPANGNPFAPESSSGNRPLPDARRPRRASRRRAPRWRAAA